ncbi:hypothetical protein AAHH88_00495 [Candidatus Hodgkinia cicadicola]
MLQLGLFSSARSGAESVFLVAMANSKLECWRSEAMAIAVKKFGDVSASSISASVKCVVASLCSMGVDVER